MNVDPIIKSLVIQLGQTVDPIAQYRLQQQIETRLRVLSVLVASKV